MDDILQKKLAPAKKNLLHVREVLGSNLGQEA
jgi:hypothetical protein